MFIGVMTNALFALVAKTAAQDAHPALLWAINGGLVLFLLGLIIDVSILIRIGAPLMGLALIYAIYIFFARLSEARANVAV
jgi:Zn-dependent membrane protease YugP